MRNRVVKAYAVGVMTGSLFTAGFVMLAAPAKADTDRISVIYAAHYGGVICQVLDEYPSEAGILGISDSIIDDGLTAYQAGEALFVAVDDICPRHLGLLETFASDHAGSPVIA